MLAEMDRLHKSSSSTSRPVTPVTPVTPLTGTVYLEVMDVKKEFMKSIPPVERTPILAILASHPIPRRVWI